MNATYKIESSILRSPDLELAYRVYSREYPENRQLLMLHGAGVSGQLTWELIIRRLANWSTIVVPDLRGAGKTRHRSRCEHAFTHQQLLGDLDRLVEQQGWEQFDVAGYSFGGLLAMLMKQRFGDRIDHTFLLEPALFDRRSVLEVRVLREQITDIAHGIRHHRPGHGLEEQLARFLDLVSPHRPRAGRAEEISIQRLAHRPVGLANALDCVTRTLHQVDRDQLLAAQQNTTSFYGGHSHPSLASFHRHIALHQSDWATFEIAGTDHSLPFQKPTRIASIMNQRIQSPA